MPDSHDRTKKSDNANAQERAREALERGVAEIKTPEQARHALDSLEKIAGDLREEDVENGGGSLTALPISLTLERSRRRRSGRKCRQGPRTECDRGAPVCVDA